jgi:hypothetical protein
LGIEPARSGGKHASPSSETLAVRSQRVYRSNSSARTMFRRLLVAVVNGSYHPCWRTNDAWCQLALLPPREQKRVLDFGRVTRLR